MILDNKTEEKPEINYPTKWGFKVIGKDKTKVQEAIKEIMGKKAHTCKFSNSTSKGNFHSYSAECTVDSQEERDNLYKAFGKHDDVHYVIQILLKKIVELGAYHKLKLAFMVVLLRLLVS